MATPGGGIRRREAPLPGAQNGAFPVPDPATRGGQTWPPQVAGSGALLRLFLAPKTAPLRRRFPPPVGAMFGLRRWRDPAPCCALFRRPKRRLSGAGFRHPRRPCLASTGGGIQRLVAPFLGAQNGALLRLPLPSLCGIRCLRGLSVTVRPSATPESSRSRTATSIDVAQVRGRTDATSQVCGRTDADG